MFIETVFGDTYVFGLLRKEHRQGFLDFIEVLVLLLFLDLLYRVFMLGSVLSSSNKFSRSSLVIVGNSLKASSNASW